MTNQTMISAVICTLNRGQAITQTIESLVAQDLPSDRFEILIVDNASSPANAAILVAQAGTETGNIRYVREAKIGESSARNCGVRESQGELIAFIDDDAIASPSWLRSICTAFEHNQKLGAIGGKIRLQFEAPRPTWLGDDLLPYLSAFDQGADPLPLKFPDYPRGTNMAFRRQTLSQAGPFSKNLGLVGSRLLSMSETELCYRIAEQAWDIEYLPSANVDHIISVNRLNPAWFARRIRWQGRSRIHFEVMHHGRLHVLARIPGQLWGTLQKRGLHRWLHLGYLAGLPHCMFRGPSKAAPPIA